MGKTIRIQGMILAVALLGASGMNASAHSDDAGMEVSGETSPIVPETVSDADRALRLNPSDTTNALHITLPPAHAPQQSSRLSGPLQVGFHRTMPDEYQDDLAPKLEGIPLHDGTIASTLSVTSPGATGTRMGILVDLPPGGEIRFFGTDMVQHFPVITRADIVWKGDKPQTLWSPLVEGDMIGIEIVLPSEEAWSSFSFKIDRISHIYGTDGGFGYPPQELQCSNHIDVQCAVGQFPQNQENAVGSILYEKPGGSYLCSGTLMNDRVPDTYVPYFLTANHCVSTGAEARSVLARWFYKRAACGGSGIDSRDTTTYGGTDLLTTSVAQDSTLLRFRGQPPSGVRLSAWSRGEVTHPTNVYGLHHPDGDVMKYSGGRTRGHQDITVCDPEAGSCFVVEDAIEVSWDEGTIEGGSSGSGLRNGQYLIGTLSGAGGSCTDRPSFYGSFRISGRRRGPGLTRLPRPPASPTATLRRPLRHPGHGNARVDSFDHPGEPRARRGPGLFSCQCTAGRPAQSVHHGKYRYLRDTFQRWETDRQQ